MHECVRVSGWVGEGVTVGCHVCVTGLQDVVGVQVGGELKRMAESVSRQDGWGMIPQSSLSLSLSLSPSSLTSWSRQCVSQASVCIFSCGEAQKRFEKPSCLQCFLYLPFSSPPLSSAAKQLHKYERERRTVSPSSSYIVSATIISKPL